MSFSVISHVLRQCIEASSSLVARGKFGIRFRGIRNWKSLAAMYRIEERGCLNSQDYRLFICDENGPVSLLHDIPLFADPAKKYVNMVVEIPRWTNAKMEISLKEALNPLKQDVKKGKLRYVANCFPHHGYIWNYGAVPQTWENPNILDEATGCKGDNDPVDILEIGSKVYKRGEVVQVKILGAIALIDEGETDWKIISVNINDPAADLLEDIPDVEKNFPGLLKATIEWFKVYKVADGKAENQFAFNGEAKNKDFAMQVIHDVHKYWKSLMKKEIEGSSISCLNTTVADNPFKISYKEANEIMAKAAEPGCPLPLDPSVQNWNFLHLK